MMATGIQAMGLMGRRNWMTGFTTRFTAGYQPKAKPSGIPVADAKPKPMATRRNESKM